VGPLLVRALGGRNHCCAEQVPLRDEETREGVRYLSTPKTITDVSWATKRTMHTMAKTPMPLLPGKSG